MAEPIIKHYSEKPVREIYSVSQKNHRRHKPAGFWLSVEDGHGWKEWCESEQWGLHRLSCEHIVELAPTANILRLTTDDEIYAFSREFGVRDGFGVGEVAWPTVAGKWQGIIIAPYQWDCRFDDDCFWYYGWDCSSGCVWDAGAIARIVLVESVGAVHG